ncbi:MAG: helix-turn-helix domain-containing protein [Oscillospiraceae bacterium]|nr:helix-turn-helix domain-containing protein [Oscillospiraceae bacterium]
MKLYIGENLKKHRKMRDLTQEELANILGVSFQSVSKWERGEGYPDMELLPTIAEYFGMTVDELMGMKNIRETGEADNILNTVRKNYPEGKIEENIKLLEEAAKRFPNDYRLLAEYASNLTFLNVQGEVRRENNLKAISIAKRILSECTDLEICRRIQGELCWYYERSGQTDKAIEAADSLMSMWNSSEMVKMAFLKGEELVKFAQCNATSLAMALSVTMEYLSDLSCENDPELTCEQRIKIQQKIIALYDIIFDEGDYNFYAWEVYKSHRHIAALAMLTGNHSLALDSLEKAAKYALEADSLPDSKPYTSLLVNRLTYSKKNIHRNFTYTYREELLEKLGCDRYDGIRNDPRFKAVEKSLA